MIYKQNSFKSALAYCLTGFQLFNWLQDLHSIYVHALSSV